MNDQRSVNAIRAYRKEVKSTFATARATEHSYRSALQSLVRTLGGNQVRALNEPSQVDCGAPDLSIERRGVPVGHIECKEVGANLDKVEESEQVERYRAGLTNLLLTNYLEFRWYVSGERREVVRLAYLNDKAKIVADEAGAVKVGALIDAFMAAAPSSVRSARELAKLMASKARLLRDCIERILKHQDQSGPLEELLLAYRKVLISRLSQSQFADMQAQTAAYGLFAARCLHDPDRGKFTRQSAVFTDTTPFLRDVFGRIAGPSIDPRISWIVDDLALLLDRTDMTEILRNFGKPTRSEDPVVHFYENFLSTYDPELRRKRGVYFTPEPVVSYIVRSVDAILRNHFGIALGLADSTDSRPVLILDPAVGTGTFLREVIAIVRETIASRGLAGAWRNYVQDHLLSRLFGFELMMAPYAICHLKIALEIGGSTASYKLPEGQRLGVFLTNALEEGRGGETGPLFAHEISREVASANAIKLQKPVMVVLGNPPYKGHSANKGVWIKHLLEEYKRGVPELKKSGQAKWLSDDYVKFIRFAQWRIERTGEGIVGFVTNHGYLSNLTFQGMRRSLMETFDEIYVLDLHGNVNTEKVSPDGHPDKNVFDIKQGVAISLFVKHRGTKRSGLAHIYHADLWGERERGPHGGKYGWLNSNDISSTQWEALTPEPPLYRFVPNKEMPGKEFEKLRTEYAEARSIPEIFSRNGSPAPGIVTTHDQFAISWTEEEAQEKVEKFLTTESETEARSYWRLCSQDQWKYERAIAELSDGAWRNRIHPILYRPFDIRMTVLDRNVAVHRRERVMQHMINGANLALSTTKSIEIQRGWEHAFVARTLIQHHAVSNKEVNYLFPLYLYPENGISGIGEMREVNLNPEFLREIEETFRLDFVSEGKGNLRTEFGPEDIFHYIYGILHSPRYRQVYAEFLKTGFPRIPLTTTLRVFISLVGFGQRLSALHLLETEGGNSPGFPRSGENRVVEVRYVPPEAQQQGQVWINAKQYFDGVPLECWEFRIGGYQPARKWLEDRKRHTLNFDDISKYSQICATLGETCSIMSQIDKMIDENGGWPLAAS